MIDGETSHNHQHRTQLNQIGRRHSDNFEDNKTDDEMKKEELHEVMDINDPDEDDDDLNDDEDEEEEQELEESDNESTTMLNRKYDKTGDGSIR